MSFTLVELSEVAEIFNGKTPSKAEQRDKGFPVLKIKDISEHRKFKGIFESFVDESVALKSKSKFLRLNDTLILNAAHNADYVGSKQYRVEPEVVGCLPTGEWLLVRATAGNILDGIYLNFWLRSDFARHQIKTLVKGIHLYPKDVARLKIPLPPLPIQKQIAAVLEKADTLRQQCQQMEQELNALAHAVFLEMFGDYRTSDQSGFVKLGDCADVCSGVTKGQKFNGKPTSVVPYMRVANVQDGYLDLNEVKEIEARQSDIEKYALKLGDILMTEGGDHDKLGRGAIWQGEIDNCIHQNHVFRVRFVNSYLPKFFEYLLQTQYAKQYFLKCAKKTTNLASINITQLKSLPMPNASLKAQQKFVDYIAQLDALKAVAKKTTQYHEKTFNALMQRAFKGELDLRANA